MGGCCAKRDGTSGGLTYPNGGTETVDIKRSIVFISEYFKESKIHKVIG
jgi:hypothetical protein